jgi:hypothetical protein
MSLRAREWCSTLGSVFGEIVRLLRPRQGRVNQ